MCLHREQLLLPFLSRGEEEAPRSFCTLTLLQRDTERGRERERERERLSFSAVEKRSSPYISREIFFAMIARELETVFIIQRRLALRKIIRKPRVKNSSSQKLRGYGYTFVFIRDNYTN